MKISFTEIILDSFHTVKKNIVFYIAVLGVFVLGNAALILTVQSIEKPSLLLVILLRLIQLALYVKLAVTVHRSVLLNEVWQWKRIFSWHNYESLFFGMILVIGIAAGLSMAFILFLISLFFGDGIDGNELMWLMATIVIGGAMFDFSIHSD